MQQSTHFGLLIDGRCTDDQLHDPLGRRVLGGFGAWLDVADGQARQRRRSGKVDSLARGEAGATFGLHMAPRVGMNALKFGMKPSF